MNLNLNLPPIPNTPIRTPQSRSSTKSLQLTPIWEEVVKNNRLPPDVNQDLIFKEISVRLEDLEWPVRQHAFRVLYDIIPIVSNERLDERIIQNNILPKLIINLGHPAPGIRKVASETIQKYLKRTSQSEKMLEDFLQYGVKEKDLVNSDQAGILRENITLGTIISLVDVLKPFVLPENGGYSISQSFLEKILEALSSQTKNPLYREKCLESLWKIRDMVGEDRFHLALGRIPERDSLLDLMNFKNDQDQPQKDDNSWSDETKSENSFGLMMSQDSFEFPHEGRGERVEKQEKASNGSSEEFSDGTDTETYTKEPAPNLDDEDTLYYHVNNAEVSSYRSPSFVAIDKDFSERVENMKEEKEEKERSSTPSSPRVVLEAEIQFAKNKAITMKVMEDEKDGDVEESHSETRFLSEKGDLVMKVLHNQEEMDEEEEKSRTPRRVRFGGEVIKLRTPESDTTDITIEIHEAEDDVTHRREPTIQITQAGKAAETSEPKTASQSLIPLPLPSAGKTPGRDASPSRKPEPKTPVMKESCLGGKDDSFDSAPSSSGSETDFKEKWTEEDDDDIFWSWADLRLVEENILKDLKNEDNWKIQYQALEQVKVVLINPKTIERIGKMKNHEKLNSLFKYLLHKLPQSNNQQVTTLALSIVSQMIETLPKNLILLDVEDIVQGLCRYVGGFKNLNLKIESVQSLKSLFGILEPSAVIDVLIGDGCLFSSSSKMRENSLLAIMYATMTFPSDFFDVDKILEKVTTSVADIRRRVRHAALEAVAILSQFCSSQKLAENIGRVAETLSTPSAKAQLIAAVQARLSRRLLPTISGEGLVLYALQIPASRRFGNLGNPMGADVDWILSGTGSLSTGSAKSRTQLNAAQRLEMRPTAPLSPNKWAQNDRPSRIPPPPITKSVPPENPWTIQKNRTESSMVGGKKEDNQKSQPPRFYKTQSTGNLTTDKIKDFYDFHNFLDTKKVVRAEDVTWALIPLSALDENNLGRERSNSLWGESTGEHSHFLPSSFGPLRPMYLKLQPSQEQFILSRSSDDVRRNTYYGSRKGQEDLTEIRLLTPTILREKNGSDGSYQNGKLAKEGRTSGENSTRIPVLCSNGKNVQRAVRSTNGNDRKAPDTEDSPPGNQKPVRLNNVPNGFSGPPAFLPSIHGGPPPDTSYSLHKSPGSNKFGEVDEMKLQDTMTQLSGLLTNSKGINKPANRDLYSSHHRNQPEMDTNGNNFTPKNDSEIPILENKIQNELFDRSYLKNHEALPMAVTSAPPVISTETRDQTPSTSSSNSTDFGTLSGSELRLRRLTSGPGALDGSNGLPYRNYNTYNPKLKGKKISLTKSCNKVGINGNPFPDNLKPFERPKEGLDTCFNQLESQQWEVNMLGLTSLVRLLRHHPAIVLSQLHPIIVALGRQIKNLRSQVSRAACSASAEMFLVLKRNVEPDLEELSGPLFHRSADTNRFIRADCNHALDNMADNVGHAKAVSVIISKGTTHQNATVRAVAARLLLRLSEKVGAEKLLSLPKEIRDKMLQAGANLLMEGKLETRAFAKQVFRVWSSHPSFSSLILEAVPPNVMRHISKTLISLKS